VTSQGAAGSALDGLAMASHVQRAATASSSSSSHFQGGNRMEALLLALFHEKDSGHFFRTFLKKSNNKVSTCAFFPLLFHGWHCKCGCVVEQLWSACCTSNAVDLNAELLDFCFSFFLIFFYHIFY
jgi:hypothetical protein